MAEFATARRKLVEGTEVLRTGGGAALTAGDCNALLDRLEQLRGALATITGVASPHTLMLNAEARAMHEVAARTLEGSG